MDIPDVDRLLGARRTRLLHHVLTVPQHARTKRNAVPPPEIKPTRSPGATQWLLLVPTC